MAIRVGINGFGRIGRLTFRVLMARPEFEVVAINDLIKPDYMAYLLKYDSTHGQFSGSVKNTENALLIDHHSIRITSEKSPENINWGELDIDALTKAYGCQRSRVIAALDYLQEQAMISLESKKMTEVFEVYPDKLVQPELARQLHQYFVQKEHSEIERVNKLVNFFQLDNCLSAHLAHYFDDFQAPKQCGHCSVCKGSIAKLNYCQTHKMPTSQQLQSYLDELQRHLVTKGVTEISLETCCRFLAGLVVPAFSRYKVRQLAGFASCEHIRYQEIRAKVAELMSTS